ncbi:MAG TPA: hypothetical protein VIY48_19155 [Candidatus Paceibacterota bacterium]
MNWVTSVLLLLMAANTMYQRWQIITLERWIDDIIESLENPDEEAGNDAIDSLLVRRSK